MSFNAPKPARRLLATALAVALSGCATVNGGWCPERTTLTSDPPAAAVTAEGEAVGETPVTAPLRKRPHWWGDGHRAVVLRFEKEGFAASEFQVAPRLNRWIFGNLALAALSGALAAADRSHFDGMHPGLVSAGTLFLSIGVDFFSGAAFTLPRSVDTRLTPRPADASRRRPLDAPAARVRRTQVQLDDATCEAVRRRMELAGTVLFCTNRMMEVAAWEPSARPSP